MSKSGRSTKSGSNPTDQKSKKRIASKIKLSSSAKSLTRRRLKRIKMERRIRKRVVVVTILPRVTMRKT